MWQVRAPDKRRFWIVIFGVAVSLPGFMMVPPLARLLMICPISPTDWGIAILGATVAVGWRALGTGGVSP
jgi:hypothetical protein